jgi:hypothetical protein
MSKQKPIGKKMRTVISEGLDSFNAFKNFGVAAVEDFLNGDASKKDAENALELLEAGAFQTMRLHIETQMAAGYRINPDLFNAPLLELSAAKTPKSLVEAVIQRTTANASALCNPKLLAAVGELIQNVTKADCAAELTKSQVEFYSEKEVNHEQH